MFKNRLQCALARHTLSIALNRPIPLAHNPNAIDPRHLLRALLRQCTYLPDVKSRHFFHDYIISRYRKYKPRRSKPHTPTLTPLRRRSLLKEARRGLVYLKRANDGHPDRLLRVLAMTYGRTGKMRHVLLNMVVSKLGTKSNSSPADEQALMQLSASMTADQSNPQLENRQVNTSQHSNLLLGPKKPRIQEVPVLGPQLEALVQSQRKVSDHRFQRPLVERTEPRIPELNSWGRPMPLCRVANMRKRWYAGVLDRVMPPLPEPDWNRLRDLALGRVPWDGPVKRRTNIAQTKVEGFGLNNENLTNMDGVVSHPGVGSVSLSNELLKDETRKLLGNNPHNITPRYMRRLWGQIFLQCPLMNWDPVKHRWRVEWGILQTNKEVTLARQGQIPMDIFEGVDEEGNIIGLKTGPS